MINLIRWLIGFVEFRFSGGFADGFINACREENASLRRVHYDSGELVCECPAFQYLNVSRLAKRHGGRLRITKKKGIVFPFLKIKNRYGLFAGAVMFVILICFLSCFVWNIETEGNSRIKDAEIIEFAAENGLCYGAFRHGVDKEKIENLMMASFEDCAWVHINEFGTTEKIEINETKKKPKIASAKGFANLRATDDGIIVKATVYNGWAAARKGDSVTKGDLLISGVYDSEKKKGNQFTHARGEYIAQVKKSFRLKINRMQSYKHYTSTSEYKALSFFGIKIPLYIGFKNLTSADVTTAYKYIKVNRRDIPLGIITTTARRYVREEKTLSDSELNALCKKELDKKISLDYSDYEIIKKKTDTDLGADAATVKCRITALKDIGEEVPLKFKKAKK
ncbi:MAG: sporulation protein YqfD [Eubacterium sp.]|nr:sporulation protein YqfD [Eubacterium sp.]